jgi:hypothetical protein
MERIYEVLRARESKEESAFAQKHELWK